jgi:transposase-like protein
MVNQKLANHQPLCPYCNRTLYDLDYHSLLQAYSCPGCHKLLSLAKITLDAGSSEILRSLSLPQINLIALKNLVISLHRSPE